MKNHIEKMSPKSLSELSRRERQIMDILFEHQNCSAKEVLERLPNPPSYSAVRALLARLVEQELVRHYQQGNRYIYSPVMKEGAVQKSAIKRLVQTFFKGSSTRAFNALLDSQASELSSRELADIGRKIKRLQEAKSKTVTK